MAVSGSGNYVIDYQTVNVGNYGAPGNATIDGTAGGFNEIVTNFNIGTGGQGNLTLTGGPDEVDIDMNDQMPGSGFSAAVRVGINGTGSVLIESGAVLRSTNSGFYNAATQNNNGTYYSVNVGRGAGAQGTITVDGTGSLLIAAGLAPRITVGRDAGTGTLNLQNGGDAGVLSIVAGRQNGGNGTINIDGVGSVLTLSDYYGQFSSYQGNDYSGSGARADIGRQGGNGYLNITDGGVLNILNTDGVTDGPVLQIARNSDSSGEVTISGSGSELNLVQTGVSDNGNSAFVGLGRSGQGIMTVEQGGALNVTSDDGAFLALGDGYGSDAVNGLESRLTILSGGTVNLEDVTTGDAGVNIARDAGSVARIEVDGAGSELNITSDNGTASNERAFLFVGRDGNGTLEVTDGGSVTLTDDSLGLFMAIGGVSGSGDASTGSGTVNVDGDGSEIVFAGTDATDIANADFLSVGRSNGASGTLNITNGGAVRHTTTLSAVEVGGTVGSTGSVQIDGIGSELDAGDELLIGADRDGTSNVPTPLIGGNGSLTVQNGGALTVDDLLIVGTSGTLDMDGRIFGGGATASVDIYGSMQIAGTGFGLARMNHDFTLGGSSSASLSIDIGGAPNAQHDRILNGQEATLADGNVNFSLGNGFLPTAGQEITFVTANGGASLTGETSFTITGVDNSFEFDVVDNGNDLAFRAITDAVAGTGTVFVGGSGDDGWLLFEGDDAAYGNGGNDSFLGDLGDDMLFGGDGDDTMDGEGDNDLLDGGRGNDDLQGGDGDDVLKEFTGNDTLNGGDGIDTVDYSALGSAITVNLKLGGAQTISAAGGADVLSNIENIVGSKGGDALRGNDGDNVIDGFTGNDTLVGFDGEDTLIGGTSNDILSGGDGNDTLIGGLGRDILNGGTGLDTFLFETLADSPTGGVARDRIQNFEQGSDTIDLSALDADSTMAGDQAFVVRTDGRFTGTAGELRFVQTAITGKTIVQVDIDGDRSRDFEFEMLDLLTLTDSDFIL